MSKKIAQSVVAGAAVVGAAVLGAPLAHAGTPALPTPVLSNVTVNKDNSVTFTTTAPVDTTDAGFGCYSAIITHGGPVADVNNAAWPAAANWPAQGGPVLSGAAQTYTSTVLPNGVYDVVSVCTDTAAPQGADATTARSTVVIGSPLVENVNASVQSALNLAASVPPLAPTANSLRETWYAGVQQYGGYFDGTAK